MEFKLPLLVFLGLISVVFSATCGQTACTTCLQDSGCNWCQHFEGANVCTAAKTAQAANCTGMGETPDVWIINVNSCGGVGGCSDAEDCSTCQNLQGCGWCFVGTSVGCIPTTDSCVSLAIDTCVEPCIAYSDCDSCTMGASCQWCATDVTSITGGTCGDKGATCAATVMTTTTQCPVPPPQKNSGLTLVASVGFVVAALLFF